MREERKVAYYIEITLETDGDYSFVPRFFNFHAPEWIDIFKISEDADGSLSWQVKVFDDIENKMWKDGGWSDYIARSFVSNFISALHVSSTHLYIWRYFLEIEEKVSKWVHYNKDEKSKSWYVNGNYDGTEIRIIRGD